MILGSEWHNSDQTGRNNCTCIFQVAALPGVLFPHVLGHGFVWSYTWVNFLTCFAQLYRYVKISFGGGMVKKKNTLSAFSVSLLNFVLILKNFFFRL